MADKNGKEGEKEGESPVPKLERVRRGSQVSLKVVFAQLLNFSRLTGVCPHAVFEKTAWTFIRRSWWRRNQWSSGSHDLQDGVNCFMVGRKLQKISSWCWQVIINSFFLNQIFIHLFNQEIKWPRTNFRTTNCWGCDAETIRTVMSPLQYRWC